MAGELGKAIGLTHGVGRRTQDVGPSEAAVFKAFSAAAEKDVAEKKQRQKDLEEIYKDLSVKRQFKSQRIQNEWANESASTIAQLLDAYMSGDANSYVQGKDAAARLRQYGESAMALDSHLSNVQSVIDKDRSKYATEDQQTIDGKTYNNWMQAFEDGVPMDKLKEYYESGELLIKDNSEGYAQRGLFPYAIDYRPTPMSDPYKIANERIAAEDMIEERRVSQTKLPLSGDVETVYRNFLPKQKVTDITLATSSDIGVNRRWMEDSYQRIKAEKAANGEPYTRAMFESDQDALKGAVLLGANALESYISAKQSGGRVQKDRMPRPSGSGGDGASWADNWSVSTYVSDDSTVKGATMSPKTATTSATRNISIPKGAEYVEAGKTVPKTLTTSISGISAVPFGFEWDSKVKGLDGAKFLYSSEYDTKNQKIDGRNTYKIPLNRESLSNFISASKGNEKDVIEMIRSVSDQNQWESINKFLEGINVESYPESEKSNTPPEFLTPNYGQNSEKMKKWESTKI